MTIPKVLECNKRQCPKTAPWCKSSQHRRPESHAATSKWLIIIRNSIQVVLRVKKAHIGRFYTKDALSVRTNFGKHFEVRLVMRLKYKDGRKTHYASIYKRFSTTKVEILLRDTLVTYPQIGLTADRFLK